MVTTAFHMHLGAVAMLMSEGRFLGTCFAFRWPHILLTAAHCVRGARPDSLIVRSQYGNHLTVTDVNCHPTADVAAIVTEQLAGGIPRYFAGLEVFAGTYGLGDEFASFGFPVGGTQAEPANEPTPRIFRGFTQRLADFQSEPVGTYRAYELSIPAPEGLSGGPVFVPGSDRVFGLVTGNFESYTLKSDVVERTEDGAMHRETHIRVVSYGMAAALMGVQEWLRLAAPLSGTALW